MENIDRTVARLAAMLPGKVIATSDRRFQSAISIWAESTKRPKIVVQCLTTSDVQAAVRAAQEAGLPLSVKAGGHDWAARAICDGLVIDLSQMRDVVLTPGNPSARVGGGTRAIDLVAHTDSLGVVPVTGSVGVVGLAGLTLGGGYGPLIARFGLASDNLLAAEVVLADGTVVTAGENHDRELLWALRGGGGNFGIVTALHLRLHPLPSVHCGIILYPFTAAKAVLDGVAAILEDAPDELTAQAGIVSAPDGQPLVAVVPTWSGILAEAEQRVAPLLRLGNLFHADVKQRLYGDSLTLFDGPMIDVQDTFIETRWVARLSPAVVDILIAQTAKRPTPKCYLVTHEFRGAALLVSPEATAFGFRKNHILLEIITQFDGKVDDGAAERAWAKETSNLLAPLALPGGYANLLAGDEPERTRQSFGPNAERLAAAKRRYDPTNVFSSAIALPSSG